MYETLADLAERMETDSGAEALHQINEEVACDVSIVIPGRYPEGVAVHVSGTAQLPDDTEVQFWVVHGTAWDGTDWEFYKEVESCEELERAINEYYQGLDDHSLETEI